METALRLVSVTKDVAEVARVKVRPEWRIPECPYCYQQMAVTLMHFPNGERLDAWFCINHECDNGASDGVPK